MLGVSMQRLCPDQTAHEAARKASVDAALYVPASPSASVKAKPSGKSAMTVKEFRKRSAGKSR